MMTDHLTGFHITWVTHNARISERMVTFGAKVGPGRVLSLDERNLVQSFLSDKIVQMGWKVIALNVLEDHVHCILVCNESDRDEIVGQLKGYSAYMLNRNSRASASHRLVNRGVYPSETKTSDDKPAFSDGTRNKVWGKGYSHTYLFSEGQLVHALESVEMNHIKHNIPPLKQPFSNWMEKDEKETKTLTATSIRAAFGG